MRGSAHLGLAAATVAPLAAHLGYAGPVALAAGLFGSLLPDIDCPDSVVGRWVPWPAVREGWRTGRWRPGGVVWHRDEVHSVGAAVAASALAATAAWWAHSWLPPGAWWAAALGTQIGYLSHLAADQINPTPEMLFWPLSRRRWRLRWLPAIRENSFLGRMLDRVVGTAAILACLVQAIGAHGFAVPDPHRALQVSGHGLNPRRRNGHASQRCGSTPTNADGGTYIRSRAPGTHRPGGRGDPRTPLPLSRVLPRLVPAHRSEAQPKRMAALSSLPLRLATGQVPRALVSGNHPG